jgi:hypothetical protein
MTSRVPKVASFWSPGARPYNCHKTAHVSLATFAIFRIFDLGNRRISADVNLDIAGKEPNTHPGAHAITQLSKR